MRQKVQGRSAQISKCKISFKHDMFPAKQFILIDMFNYKSK